MLALITGLSSPLICRFRSRATLELEVVALRHQLAVLRRRLAQNLIRTNSLVVSNAWRKPAFMAIRQGKEPRSPGSELRTRTSLAAESVALRHQIAALERRRTRRRCFRRFDRLFWILLSRWWPLWRESLVIVQSETVSRWRRSGWSAMWRYRSGGRWARRAPAPPSANSIAEASRIDPPQSVAIIANRRIANGTEIMMVVTLKGLARRGSMPESAGNEHVMHPDQDAEQTCGDRRVNLACLSTSRRWRRASLRAIGHSRPRFVRSARHASNSGRIRIIRSPRFS